MAHVLSPGRSGYGCRWSRAGLIASLAVVLPLFVAPASPGQTGKSGQAADNDAKAKPAKDDAAQAPDVAEPPAADSVRSRRIAPVEVFKDPNAEAILDIKSLRKLRPAPFADQDYRVVLDQARNPNLIPDRTLIDRVVRGLAAQLTDEKSIQAILEGPAEEAPPNADGKKAAPTKRKGDGGAAIQAATVNLLKPIFVARSQNNASFLNTYRRSLHQYLPRLVTNNHLIPRVQAMIVLGEAATPTQDALKLFVEQIESRSQALWVKLWALEGISNIKKEGNGFSADIESRTALSISKFLEAEREKELPWPIQMRALETIGWLRRSGLPVSAARADIANTAMLFLSKIDSRIEVRSEAARALGLMQVNAVPNYNFQLVAYYTGLLAAEIADQINDQFEVKPVQGDDKKIKYLYKADKNKTRYLLAMLAGPVYECFSGVEGLSNSGILLTSRPNANALKYCTSIFELLRPVVQAAVELMNSPTRNYAERKETLAGRINDLRSFLKQTPPESRRLVQGGRVYGANGAPAAGAAAVGARQPAAAGALAGRPGGR